VGGLWGSAQKPTGGPICQANHAAPKLGLNIRPVTRNRWWAALDRTGRLKFLSAVSNQDIGYLKPGQAVEIKVDTFPFQKYGSLKGTLTWVSADAEDKNAASSDLDTRSGVHATEEPQSAANNQNAGYVYNVHVRTEQMQFVVDGSPSPIRAGMTVQADIITDRRRVIDFFLSPVVKYLDEGLRVR